MNKYLVLALGCALVASSGHVCLWGNPSTKDPEVLLKIRAGEKVADDYLEADYAAITQRYQRAKAGNDELWKKFSAGKLALGDGRQVGPLVLLQAATRRDADFLKLRGEACGWDLALRVDELDTRLRQAVGEIMKAPGFNQTPIVEQLKKDSAAGVKRLPQIEGLMKRQQFLQAEGELYEILDSLARGAIWLPGFELKMYYEPFKAPVMEAIELRKAKSLAELQAVTAQSPDFAKLTTELKDAATAVGSSGQAMWNGQAVSGPDLLTAWHTNWPKLQAASQRAAMAEWAIDHLSDGTRNHYQARQAAHQQFLQGLPALLAAVIRADAQRADGPTAAALYEPYLSAAATLCAFGPRQELESAFTPALAALATKAGIDKDVAVYRAATEPVLAWKRFFARAQAKSLSTTLPPVHTWCAQVLNRPAQAHTILSDPQDGIQRAKIVSTTSQVLPAVLPAGPAPVVVVNDAIPVSAAGGRWVARYQQRVFALIAAPPPAVWQAATALLEQQLLVTPETKPLSLEAAISLAGARAGVFESVGGPVEQVTLEPLLTRFITLPDDAGTLLTRGPLPAEDFQNVVPGQCLSVRCDILQPQWLQHECFVLRP